MGRFDYAVLAGMFAMTLLVGLILLILCSGVDHGKIRDHTLQD